MKRKLIINLTALLYVIADSKFHKADEAIGFRVVGEWLTLLNIDQGVVKHVQEIIKTISFNVYKAMLIPF